MYLYFTNLFIVIYSILFMLMQYLCFNRIVLLCTFLEHEIKHSFLDFLYSVLHPFQDYFSSCVMGQSVGGSTTEEP